MRSLLERYVKQTIFQHLIDGSYVRVQREVGLEIDAKGTSSPRVNIRSSRLGKCSGFVR